MKNLNVQRKQTFEKSLKYTLSKFLKPTQCVISAYLLLVFYVLFDFFITNPNNFICFHIG